MLLLLRRMSGYALGTLLGGEAGLIWRADGSGSIVWDAAHGGGGWHGAGLLESLGLCCRVCRSGSLGTYL